MATIEIKMSLTGDILQHIHVCGCAKGDGTAIEQAALLSSAVRHMLGELGMPWEDCRGWYTVDKKGNVKPYTTLPVTHWMPLPEPPEEPK